MRHLIQDIDRNAVVIAGTSVPRPSSISPMQWVEFWEDASERGVIGDGAEIPMTNDEVRLATLRTLRKRKRKVA
jgi:hypothetical protein